MINRHIHILLGVLVAAVFQLSWDGVNNQAYARYRCSKKAIKMGRGRCYEGRRYRYCRHVWGRHSMSQCGRTVGGKKKKVQHKAPSVNQKAKILNKKNPPKIKTKLLNAVIYRKKHCPSLSAPERKAVLGRRYKGRRTVQIRGEVIAQRYKRLCKIDDVVNLCFQHTRPQGWKCVKNSFFTKLIQKVKVSKVLPLKKVVAEKKTLLKKMKKTTPVVAVDLDKQRIKKEMAAQKERQRIAEEQRVAEQQRQKTKALESAAKKAVAAKEEKIKEQAALNQEVEEVQNKGEAPDLFEGGRKAEYVGRLIEKIKPLLKKVFVREKSNTEHCVNRVRSISILDPDIKKRYKGMSSKKVQILGNAIVTYIQLAADHCLDIQSAGVQGLKVSTFKEHYSKKYGAEVSIDDAVLKDYNSLIEIENRTEDLVKPNQQRYIDLNHDFIEAMVDMKEYADSTENQDQHYFDDWRAMLFFAQLDELAFESEELFELAQKMLGSK